MKDTPLSQDDWDKIAEHAAKLGFMPTKDRNIFSKMVGSQNDPHCFSAEVDLSASGNSFEAVAKNIVSQLFDQLREEYISMINSHNNERE